MNKIQNVNSEELKHATMAMIYAGYGTVTVDKVQKLDNEFGFIVYAAVIYNGIVIYVPTYHQTVQFVPF